MSHVDDGTLHAYLDGELSALEAVRVEAHADECPACRARLADARGLIARASELLEAAVPPERPAPPLRARPPRRAWRSRWPMAAAASVVLALAIGWGVGARGPFRWADSSTPVAPPPEVPRSTPAAPAAPTVDVAVAVRDEDARTKPSVESVEPAEAAEPPEAPERRVREAPAEAAARDPGAGRASLAAATRDSVAAPAAGSAAPGALAARSTPSAGDLSVRTGGELLGAELLGVPGLPVRSVRRAHQPGFAAVVLVEQALDSARTIQIVHRRAAAGAGPTPEARQEAETDAADSAPATLTGLDIEVTGALSVDSLMALRRALRPLPR
jgi:anti-sigma factor RsiW